MWVAIAPSMMLHVVSMQPGHADIPCHTALTHIAHSAIYKVGTDRQQNVSNNITLYTVKPLFKSLHNAV